MGRGPIREPEVSGRAREARPIWGLSAEPRDPEARSYS